MPIILPSETDAISVVASVDTALDQMDEGAYDRYIETLDESHLKFKIEDGKPVEPTRFRLRKVLPWKLAQKIEDMKLGMSNGEAVPRMAWMGEEVRVSLIGIDNPPGTPKDQELELKKHGDGGALPDFVAKLMAAGIVNDLWRARQSLGKADTGEVDKKK